jgi:thiol:disulfide interchange protein DsbC
MSLKVLPLLPSVAAALLVAGVVQAQAPQASGKANAVATAAGATAAKEDPRAAIVKKIEGIKLEDVRMTPVEGIYEVTRGSDISYSSADGRYVIVGDMIDVDNDSNMSESRRRVIRTRLIDSVPESEMLVFSPKNPKYTVTVFTDIDCGYCRKLHSQIAEYNKQGIRVRYLFYPRTGPNTESWAKAEAVWCSANRNDALTRAKNGEDLKVSKCPADIVARDWELGHKLSLEGTPAIFLPNGEMLPGYSPPTQLARILKTAK